MSRRRPRWTSLAVVVWAGVSAADWQEGQLALDAYDLSKGAGAAFELTRSLEEISGLATTEDGRLFAHDDERAVVYELDPADGAVRKAFAVGATGLPGDFEGLAIASERFFLVTSAGELLEFREGEAGSAVPYRVHPTTLEGRCEIEGLEFDPEENVLLLPCKEPRSKALRDHLVVFSVSLESMEAYGVPAVFLPLEELETQGLDPEFHPSAIVLHPHSGTILLASAQDEAIVELTRQGRLLAARKLPKKEHPQTEGLAVLLDGSLVLADEGQGKRGRLTRYAPRRGGEAGNR